MYGSQMTAGGNRPTMAEVASWGIDMRRDDELIRKFMFEMEDAPEWVVWFFPDHDNAEEQAKYFHLRLLVDEGFLEETGKHGGNFRITNAGHDFIGMMRDDGLWSQMKARAAKAVPRYGLRLLFEVGNGLVRERLREMGLPLD
ncbi:DUF2513 domain-containing protein [uncultured Mameliella sp.]|uniref:DUF2513 domain-containing protein n=1 Tax=uncultured Mameliella sp. TaxID=1447087 RepID=UPI002626E5A2|nr:DUF2513 domain-containing protein [uncultured Mameliella sp.]